MELGDCRGRALMTHIQYLLVGVVDSRRGGGGTCSCVRCCRMESTRSRCPSSFCRATECCCSVFSPPAKSSAELLLMSCMCTSNRFRLCACMCSAKGSVCLFCNSLALEYQTCEEQKSHGCLGEQISELTPPPPPSCFILPTNWHVMTPQPHCFTNAIEKASW